MSRVRALAGGHRWLAGAVVAMLVATAVLDPTIGAADAPPLLDLGPAPTTTTTTTTRVAALPVAPVPTRPAVPLPPGPVGPPAVAAAPDVTTATTAPPATPPAEPPAPTPCAAAAVVELVAEAQRALEAAAGTALAVDVAGLFAGLAGCTDSAAPNPLDALGVVAQVLDALGIDAVPLPTLPELPLPTPPPAGFDALGPVVLPVCATVIKQLVTVASLAPVLRIRTPEVIALVAPVVQVCALFAPQA